MPNLKLVGAMCLAFAILGLVSHQEKVYAAVPNACPQFKCKNLTYWWDGSKTVIKAAFVPGLNDTVTFTGFAAVFSPTSNFDLPNAATGAKFDVHTYIACSPYCGKDAMGAWQAIQDVSASGPHGLSQKDAVQFSCKSVGPAFGDTVAVPLNLNAMNKNTPPGS